MKFERYRHLKKTTCLRLRTDRFGVASILVLVAVMALSLAVYRFSDQSQFHYRMLRIAGRQLDLRLAAASGIDWAKAQVAMPIEIESSDRLKSDTDAIGQLLDKSIDIQVGIFHCGDPGLQRGLLSECSKLSLDSLDLNEAAEEASRNRLVQIPGITPAMADALLDWMDEDDQPREFGAEASWYADNQPGARPRNRPIQSLSELNSIRGFDAAVLYGEDTNDNGWLDWNEDDGAFQPPIDNGDGVLDRGIIQFLTAIGFESNRDRQGRPKINLNDRDLPKLHNLLQTEFGTEVANFVAAYRIDGPYLVPRSVTRQEREDEIQSTFETRLQQQMSDAFATASNDFRPQAASPMQGAVSLNRTPAHEIRSLFDLWESSVITIIDGEERLLESPWKSSSTEGHRVLRQLEDRLTTVDGLVRSDRIDIRQASIEVLKTIPGITHEMAVAIDYQRQIGSSIGSELANWTPLWLVENRICTLDTLRKIGPFVTASSSVYSGLSIARDCRKRTQHAIGFALCRDGDEVRVLEWRDIGVFPVRETERTAAQPGR